MGELGIGIAQQEWYYPLPLSCRCRRYITLTEATESVACGQAVWLLKVKKQAVIPDEKRIWMPIVREKVPRVDLISRPDIERAVIGSERISKHYQYNPRSKRYVMIRIVPEGMTKTEWMEDAKKEIAFEKRIRSQYQKYIEECHKIYMDNRAKLMVPFKPDPFEGRTLFTFANDQRTFGGIGEQVEYEKD